MNPIATRTNFLPWRLLGARFVGFGLYVAWQVVPVVVEAPEVVRALTTSSDCPPHSHVPAVPEWERSQKVPEKLHSIKLSWIERKYASRMA